jgi:hypothetical protein
MYCCLPKFCLEIGNIGCQLVLDFITGGTGILEFISHKTRRNNFYMLCNTKSVKDEIVVAYVKNKFSRKTKLAVCCNEKTFRMARLHEVSGEANCLAISGAGAKNAFTTHKF